MRHHNDPLYKIIREDGNTMIVRCKHRYGDIARFTNGQSAYCSKMYNQTPTTNPVRRVLDLLWYGRVRNDAAHDLKGQDDG